MALATCAALPELDDDEAALVPALERLGIEGVPAVWDDPTVRWEDFALVVLRSTWDYAERHEEFLRWARSLPRVLNGVRVLEWNVDKRYLEGLGAAGIPIVPTQFVPPGAGWNPPATPFVVKPSISAGGRSSAWIPPGDADRAHALVERIHGEGRTAMLQPYLADSGETALVFIDGAYSHALSRRVPLPSGADREVFFLDEQLGPAEATPSQRAIAEAALARVPGELLYARVDVLGDAVLEVELIEPSLYFAFGHESASRLARAISARLAPLP